MEKEKGRILTEAEVEDIAMKNGEVWVSYVEYGYKDIVVEQVGTVKQEQGSNCIEIDSDVTEIQLTGRPDALCQDDGYGAYDLSLHQVVETD